MAFHPSFLPSVCTNGLFCGHPLMRKPGLACGLTDLPILETFNFTHKFGYLTEGKTNRLHHHLFGNRQEPHRQKCDHLLHLLFWILATRHIKPAYARVVWVHNITVIRANLLQSSVPWENAPDDFFVADTQTLEKSSLPLCDQPDSFITDSQNEISLHFRYMQDTGDKTLRGYLTTLLAAWNVIWMQGGSGVGQKPANSRTFQQGSNWCQLSILR